MKSARTAADTKLLAIMLGHLMAGKMPPDYILQEGLTVIARLSSDAEGLEAMEALLAKNPRRMQALVGLLAEMDELAAAQSWPDVVMPQDQMIAALGGDAVINRVESERLLSIEALNAYIDGIDGPVQHQHTRIYTAIGPVEGKKDLVAIDITFPSPSLERLWWDRLTVPARYPHLHAALLFDEISRVGDHLVPLKAKAASRPAPAMYRYHPERFEHYSGVVTGPTRPTQEIRSTTVEDFQMLGNAVVRQINSSAARYPLRQRVKHPQLQSKDLAGQVELALSVQNYRRAGSQMFDFPHSLVEMLANTDVDQVPLSMLTLPYTAQYIHFGPQADLQLKPGFFVDGAYVYRPFDGALAITLTSVPSTPQISAEWSFNPAPGFTQSYSPEVIALSVGEAVDTVLSEKMAELIKQRDAGAERLSPELQAQARESGLGEFSWVGHKTAAATLAGLPTEAEVYRQALRLVVNGLAYITAYTDDVKSEWVPGTPATMIQKTQRPGKEGVNAKSKLEAMGYRLVHLCGQGLSSQTRGAAGDRKVATHWVRGHWRNQAHGPGRTLRKMIWVMPYLVGDGDDGTPLGHLYLAS